MTPELYRRINQVLQSALEHPPDERAAFLDAACGDDAALRINVEALLAAYDVSDGFLDVPPDELAATALLEEAGGGSLIGKSVGRYQVLSVIGTGGMGTVYLAHDPRLNRKVALKVLPRHLTKDQGRVGRFRREARAASALNHPNIVTIYEMEEADGVHFIVTEYVEGTTLRQRLSNRPLNPDEALNLALQVAGALSIAHRRGIIHRDIKPENIMLRSDGDVKVLDFGLAKFTSTSSHTGDSATQTAYTTPGLIVGTVNYMSPEQARGLEVDARTDIWSLGVVLYEMLTGKKPFAAATQADTLAAILERAAEPVTAVTRTAVPDELARIVARALRKKVDERYQTIDEFASALRGLQSRPVVPPPSSSRRATLLMVSWFVLAGIIASAAVWWFTRPTAPAASTAQAVAAKPERRLSYWLLVQKYRDGKPYEEPFAPTADINFEPDYRVRLNLKNEQAGHLYILNEQLAPAAEAPVYKILFPSPTANKGLSRVEANQQLEIPEESWFRFDDKRGSEKVWIVWSRESVAALEAVKGFANERDRGVVKSPELNAAVRDLLAAPHDPPPVAERDAGQKEVVIRSNGDILPHLLRLEHH